MPRRGNTVVIILIVVGVMGLMFMAVLVALLLPAVQQAREAARRSSSKSNLKQIAVAVHNYHDTWNNLPATRSPDLTAHSWHTRMLPQMEQGALAATIDYSKDWDDPTNKSAFAVVLPALMNPGVADETHTSDGYAVTHYEGNAKLIVDGEVMQFRSVTDGTSNTIMGGEVNSNFRAWGDPAGHRDLSLGINQAPNGFGSPFNGGANFMMMDGAVRFISENADVETLRRLGDPQDGQPVMIP